MQYMGMEMIDTYITIYQKKFPIYRNSSNIGAVPGGRAALGCMGTKSVVGTWRSGLGGCAGGGTGGICGRDRNRGDKGEQGG